MRMKFEEEGTAMLPEEHLMYERGHPLGHGVQRLYRYPNGYGLIVANSNLIHPNKEVWQLLVVKGISHDGTKFVQAQEGEVPFPVERFIQLSRLERTVQEFVQWAVKDAADKAEREKKEKGGVQTDLVDKVAEKVVEENGQSRRRRRSSQTDGD